MIQRKKKYGQHFLTDKNIASKIVSALSIQENCDLIEIGPGEGILTSYLINSYSSCLHLVEIDSDLIPILAMKFPDLKDQIINIDFLELNFDNYFKKEIAVIGNFPYNISSQILFKVIQHRNKVVQLVGMFQKEVAKRICAGSGTKDYGILSVLIQAFYDTRYLFSVSRNVFSPAPEVESGVIKLVRKDKYQLNCDEKFFQVIVKQAFGQRRKTLWNSLRSFINVSTRRELLEAEQMFKKRPEELSFNDFIYLTNLLRD